MCGSGSGVAAVAIAVDREASDASRGLKRPEKQRPTRVCRMSITGLRMFVRTQRVPLLLYLSGSLEKCTLDLVLSSSTHKVRTDTVQTIAVAPNS